MALGLTKRQIFEMLKTKGAKAFDKREWSQLSQDTTITEELIEAGYLDYLNWDVMKITNEFSDEFIQKYADKINYRIAEFYTADPDTVKAISEYAQIEDLLKIANLPNSFMQEKLEELSELEEFYLTQAFVPTFLEKNKSKINWVLFSRNYGIDAELFENEIVRSNIDYKELSFNDNASVITYDFVREHQDKLDWNGISSNIKLISNIDFLEEFSDKIAWDVVYRKRDELTEKITTKFDKKLKEGKEFLDNIPEVEEKEYDTASEMAAAKKPKISKFKFLMTTLLIDHLDPVPWELLSEQKLKFSFVETHLGKNELNIDKVLKNNTYKNIDLCLLPWGELSSRITDADVIAKHHDLIDFSKLDFEKIDLSRIPGEILLRHMDEINIDNFTKASTLTEEKITELLSLSTDHNNKDGLVLFAHADTFLSKFNFTEFVSTHNVTNNFLKNNASRINWVILSTQITPEQAEALSDQVFWHVITDGKNKNFKDIDAVKQKHPSDFSLQKTRIKYGNEKEQYESRQHDIISQVLRDGIVDPAPLLNPELSAAQIEVLLSALYSKIDISDIVNDDYSPEKMLKLIEAKRMGMDISKYDEKTSVERILEDRYNFITGIEPQITPNQNMFYNLGYSQRQAEAMYELYEAEAKELYTQDFSDFSPEKIHFIAEIYKYNAKEYQKPSDSRTLIELDEILKRDKFTAQDLELLLISRQTHLTNTFGIDYIKMTEIDTLDKEQKAGLIKGYKLGLPAKKYLEGRTGKELEAYFDSITEQRNKTGKIKSAIQKIKNASHDLSQTIISFVTLNDKEEQNTVQEEPVKNPSDADEKVAQTEVDDSEKVTEEQEVTTQEVEETIEHSDTTVDEEENAEVENDSLERVNGDILPPEPNNIDPASFDGETIDVEIVEESPIIKESTVEEPITEEENIEEENIDPEEEVQEEVAEETTQETILGNDFDNAINAATESSRAQLEYLQNLSLKQKEEAIVSLINSTIIPNEEFSNMTNQQLRLRLNRDINNLTNCVKMMESDSIISRDVLAIAKVKGLIELKELNVQACLQQLKEELSQAKHDILEEVQQSEQNITEANIEKTESVEKTSIETSEEPKMVVEAEEVTVEETIAEENIDKSTEEVVDRAEGIEETEEFEPLENITKSMGNITAEEQEATDVQTFEAVRNAILDICGKKTNILVTTNDSKEINFEISYREIVYNVNISPDYDISISSRNGKKTEELKQYFEALLPETLEALGPDLIANAQKITDRTEIEENLKNLFKDKEISIEKSSEGKDEVQIHLNQKKDAKSKIEYVVKLGSDGTISLNVKDSEKHLPLSEQEMKKLMRDKTKLVNYFRFANVSELYRLCTKEKIKENVPETDNKETSQEQDGNRTTPQKEYVAASVLLKDFKTMLEDDTVSLASLKETMDDFMKSISTRGLLSGIISDNTTSVMQNIEIVSDMLMDLIKMEVENFKLKELAVKILDALIEIPYDRSGGQETQSKLEKLKKEVEQVKEEVEKNNQEKNKPKEEEKTSKQPKQNNQPKQTNQIINNSYSEKIDLLNKQIAKAVANVYDLKNPFGKKGRAEFELQIERRPKYGNEISIIGKTKDDKTLRLTFSYKTGELVKFTLDKQNEAELAPETVKDIRDKASSIKELMTLHDIQSYFALSQTALQELAQTIAGITKLDLDHAFIDIALGKELKNTGLQKNNDIYIQIQNIFNPKDIDHPMTMFITEDGKIVDMDASIDLQSAVGDFIRNSHDELFKGLKDEIQRGWHGIDSVKKYEKLNSNNTKEQSKPNQETAQMVADAQQQTIDQRMDEVINVAEQMLTTILQKRKLSLIDMPETEMRKIESDFAEKRKEMLESGALKAQSENGNEKGLLSILPHMFIVINADNRPEIKTSCTVKVNGKDVYTPLVLPDKKTVELNSRKDVYVKYSEAIKELQSKAKEKTQQRNSHEQEQQNKGEGR